MIADEVNWKGLEVYTKEAIWVCIECTLEKIPFTMGRIEYHMIFAAREIHIAGVPSTRRLCLRTSDYFVATNHDYLTNVIKGRMMATESWDDSIDVYEPD